MYPAQKSYLADDYAGASVCLSEVMEDIGVTEEFVALRRKIGIERALMSNLHFKLDGKSQYVYNFGSQSEGNFTVYFSLRFLMLIPFKDIVIRALKYYSLK